MSKCSSIVQSQPPAERPQMVYRLSDACCAQKCRELSQRDLIDWVYAISGSQSDRFLSVLREQQKQDVFMFPGGYIEHF